MLNRIMKTIILFMNQLKIEWMEVIITNELSNDINHKTAYGSYHSNTNRLNINILLQQIHYFYFVHRNNFTILQMELILMTILWKLLWIHFNFNSAAFLLTRFDEKSSSSRVNHSFFFTDLIFISENWGILLQIKCICSIFVAKCILHSLPIHFIFMAICSFFIP